MAAARRAHPAGKQTPAKKAPAKKAAAPASTKLRWRLEQERTPGNRAVEQTGVVGDAEYQIRKDGEKWKVTYKRGKTETVLASGVSYAQSYAVVVAHNKAAS